MMFVVFLFILSHTNSAGFSSGEYGGKKTSDIFSGISKHHYQVPQL